MRLSLPFLLVIVPSGPGAACRRAGEAETPEDHFGLVDRETMPIGRFKTWPFPRHAVDVLGPAAPAAHQVVMVVSDPALVACGVTGGLDPPQEPPASVHAATTP